MECVLDIGYRDVLRTGYGVDSQAQPSWLGFKLVRE